MIDAPRILAIDPATRWGWARWQPGMSQPFSGTREASGRTFGHKCRDFRDWYVAKLNDFDFTDVYAEALFPKIGKGANRTTQDTEMWQHWMIGCIQEAAIPTRVLLIAPDKWRQHFLGLSRAPSDIVGSERRRKWLKARCVARCAEIGIDVKSHDEADAVGLLDFARARLMPEHGTATTPLFAPADGTSQSGDRLASGAALEPAAARNAGAGFSLP